jgi:hypothetical protein
MTSLCNSIKRALQSARDNLREAYERLREVLDEFDPMHRPLFQHIADARGLAGRELEALDSLPFDAQAVSRTQSAIAQVLDCIEKIDNYGLG